MIYVTSRDSGSVTVNSVIWHEIDGVYATQALADAAGSLSGSTVYTGALTDLRIEPRRSIGTGADLTVHSGWWINRSDGTVSRSRPAEADSIVKQAHRALHLAGRDLETLAFHRVAGSFPDIARAKFHDILFHVREYHYLMARDTTYDDAQKIAWVQRMQLGPADIPVTGGDVEDALRRFFLRAKDFDVPDEPSAWVRPSDAVAVNLNAMVTLSGVIPDTVNLATGEWIDDL